MHLHVDVPVVVHGDLEHDLLVQLRFSLHDFTSLERLHHGLEAEHKRRACRVPRQLLADEVDLTLGRPSRPVCDADGEDDLLAGRHLDALGALEVGGAVDADGVDDLLVAGVLELDRPRHGLVEAAVELHQRLGHEAWEVLEEKEAEEDEVAPGSLDEVARLEREGKPYVLDRIRHVLNVHQLLLLLLGALEAGQHGLEGGDVGREEVGDHAPVVQVRIEVEEVCLVRRHHSLVVVGQPGEEQHLRAAVDVARGLRGDLDRLGVDHGHAPDEARGETVEAEELDELVQQHEPAADADQLEVLVVVLVQLLRVALGASIQRELLEQLVVQEVLGPNHVYEGPARPQVLEELRVPLVLLLRLLPTIGRGPAGLRGLVLGNDRLAGERLHQVHQLPALVLHDVLGKLLDRLAEERHVGPADQDVLAARLGEDGALAEELVVGDEVLQPLPRARILLVLQLDRPVLLHHRHLRARHLGCRALAGLGLDLAVRALEGEERKDAEEACVGPAGDEDAELVASVVEEADLRVEREAPGVGEGDLHGDPLAHDGRDGAEGEGEGERNDGRVRREPVLDLQVVVAVVDDEESDLARDAAGSRRQENFAAVELEAREDADALHVDGEVGRRLVVEHNVQLASVLHVGRRHEVNLELQRLAAV
eukprot:765470-Hanusia_phi.AAC.3